MASHSTSSSASSSSSSTSSSSSSSSTTSSSTGGDRSTIRTDAGTVTVQRRDGMLVVVDVTTVEGWCAERTSDDERTLVITFSRPGAQVDVIIRLTATGITSSVSSVSTE